MPRYKRRTHSGLIQCCVPQYKIRTHSGLIQCCVPRYKIRTHSGLIQCCVPRYKRHIAKSGLQKHCTAVCSMGPDVHWSNIQAANRRCHLFGAYWKSRSYRVCFNFNYSALTAALLFRMARGEQRVHGRHEMRRYDWDPCVATGIKGRGS